MGKSKLFDADLLVVGAGPVGLTAAILGAQSGLRVRVIEQDLSHVKESRAIWIHPRTLEIWDEIGFSKFVMEAGRTVDGIVMTVSGQGKAVLPYDGGELSKFPNGLMLEQSKTQELLVEMANTSGVEISWGMKAHNLIEENDSVHLEAVDGGSKPLSLRSHFVIGADGGRSTVRKLLGITMQGGTYDDLFFVVDVLGVTKIDTLKSHLNFHGPSTIACLPLPGEKRFRLIGNLERPQGELQEAGYGKSLTLDQVRNLVLENRFPMEIKEIGWSTTYRSHHRVAEKFASKRVFLAGDAAHLHSPAGGLGMNTGIADAHNLVWRLVFTQTRSFLNFLNGYDKDRRQAAEAVIATSDRLFTLQADRSPFFAFVRNRLLPNIVSVIAKTNFGKRIAFIALSGTQIRYEALLRGSKRNLGSLQLGSRVVLNNLLAIDTHVEKKTCEFTLLVSGMEVPENVSRRLDKVFDGKLKIVSLDQKILNFPSKGIALIRPDGHVGWLGTRFELLSSGIESR